MKDRQDALHRYEFLQKFLKESKQFGAQRRASEAQCVQYAMKNMATTAGYADELRLTLAMETELVTSNRTSNILTALRLATTLRRSSWTRTESQN